MVKPIRIESNLMMKGLEMAKKKMVKGEGKPVVIWVGDETVSELDRLATKLHMSRSRLARNLMECGLEDAKVMDLLGLLSLMHKIETLQEKWREKRANSDQALSEC